MRVITGGVPNIPGNSVYEQMKWLEQNDDQIRMLMLREPRGYPLVAGICEELDWPTVDIGGIEGSRLLEPMCILWVMHGIKSGSWNHAFKLLRK